MKRDRVAALLFFLLPAFLVACGYHMQSADIATLQNLAPNCAINVTLLSVDAGPALAPVLAQARATDRTCTCGARGILARAGQAEPDAGKLGCPQ